MNSFVRLGVLVFVLLSLLSTGLPPRAAPQNTPPKQVTTRVTNQEILEMVKGGLASEVIVAKIETSACDFDTSPAALTAMKAAGVSDAVILAMIKAEKPTNENPTTAGRSQPHTFPEPSSLTQTFAGHGFSFRYPGNWLPLDVEGKPFVSAMLGPEGGVKQLNSHGRLFCGILFEVSTDKNAPLNVPLWFSPTLSLLTPQSPRAIRSRWTGARLSLRKNVKEIEQYQVKANPGLAYIDSSERTFEIDQREALQVEWTNENGRGERGLGLFVKDDRGLWTWSLVTPASDFEAYRSTFSGIVQSISFWEDSDAPQIPGRSTVVVRSQPSGADITLDGKYAGYTTNTLHPTVGNHNLSIIKSGFQAWLGFLVVDRDDSFVVNADLAGQP